MRLTRTLSATALVVLLLTAFSSAADYQSGFTWDWRVDFGQPTTVSELPPNPNSDARSRTQPENAGLSSGSQASNVWQYGRTPYAELLNGTFSPSDFTIYTRQLQYGNELRWDGTDYLHGDRIAYDPTLYSLHPDAIYSNPPVAAVVRWIYPGEQPVSLRISGIVNRVNLNGDGTDFWLVKNDSATLLDYAVVVPEGLHTVDVVTSVQPGDELFLAVGCLTDSTSDKTKVDVTIQVVPEPATLSLLALGGLAVLRRRR